jgi:hypothetical protein
LTEDGGDEAAELQRIDRVLRHASAPARRRSPPRAALAAEFTAMGLTDRTGKAPTGERARKTWWRVKTDLAARATRTQQAAVQLLPSPPAPAARTTGPVGGFPPVAPDDEEPAVERPRFGFARLRGRGAPGDGSSKE